MEKKKLAYTNIIVFAHMQSNQVVHRTEDYEMMEAWFLLAKDYKDYIPVKSCNTHNISMRK